MAKKDKLLTQLELKVMNLLWTEKNAFVKDLVAKWPDDPKPAYNTISTVVRILADKGFVAHESFGRSHRYFPLLDKNQYQKRLLGDVLENAFSGSLSSLVSTLVQDRNLSNGELDELKKLINQAES